MIDTFSLNTFICKEELSCQSYCASLVVIYVSFTFFQEKQQQMEELNAKEEELLKGNPLLNNAPTSFSVKRRLGFCWYPVSSWILRLGFCWIIFRFFRWDDDVVFKNQARGEMKAPKRFINDTIRNDFHRKFLHRYMKWLNKSVTCCYLSVWWMI